MYEKHAKKLNKFKKKLTKRAKGIQKDFATKRDNRSTEAAIENENNEVLAAIYKEAIQDLEQVDKALQRIDQGVYGQCSKCSCKIRAKRLKVMPYTVLCIRCAQQLEFDNIN